jgi:Transposase DDE domain
VRAHVSAAGAKGGKKSKRLGARVAASPPRSTQKSDASGDIIAFDLTGGEASDGRHFETVLDIGPDIQPRAVICEKGYASKANRDAAGKRRIAPVIPHKANERDRPAFFARTLYKARARIEQGVGSDGSSASSGRRSAAKRPNETSDQSSVSPPAYA